MSDESEASPIETEKELLALSRLVRQGMAEREYSGVAGFLGLPRVRVVKEA